MFVIVIFYVIVLLLMSRLTTEFSVNYRPLDYETALTLSPDVGYFDDGSRPFEICKDGGSVWMKYVHGTEPQPTKSILAGALGIFVPDSKRFGHWDRDAHISFGYYEADQEGFLKYDLGHCRRLFTDVRIPLGTLSMAYGVHPDNSGEAPTFYIHGEHTGYTREDVTYSRIEESRFADSVIRSFSLARVINGPIGDPLTDAGFRERMGIENIPLRTVSYLK